MERTSHLNAGGSLSYLAVNLSAGQSWHYHPPTTIRWDGSRQVVEVCVCLTLVDAGELAIFESSNLAIDFTAESDAEFVLGSAVLHPHDLALGNYSVHTSDAALRAGQRRIDEIEQRLRSEGRL